MRIPQFINPDGAATPRPAPSGLILPAGYASHRQPVPSSQPGLDWIICSAQECQRQADKRFKVDVPHETIENHAARYLFCSNRCRQEWAAGTEFERYL